MALMTMVARVVDGLPLVGSMQEDEQVIVILQQLKKIVSIHICFQIFSQERISWNIRIKQKCYSANWDQIRHKDVPLKPDHICFSK